MDINDQRLLIDRIVLERRAKLEALIWEYIAEKMIRPEDCIVSYRHGDPWPFSITAVGFEPKFINLEDGERPQAP